MAKVQQLLQREELSRWFDAGVEKQASHLLVLEAGNGEVEPLYVYPAGNGTGPLALGDPDHALYSRWRERTVLEVYHLGMDKDLQIETHSSQRPFTLHIPEAEARPTLHPDAFRPKGPPVGNSRIQRLQQLCALFRHELVIEADPHLRPDALGATGLSGSGEAQLCENRTIVVAPWSQCLSYLVSHELAHGIAGFCDEKAVLYEQTAVLSRWVDELLKELESHAEKRLGR